MKNKNFFIVIVTALFIMLFTIHSYANTGNINFTSNVNQIKRGEVFTITLSASSENGINGINTKYTFDNNALELVGKNVIDSENWISLNSSPDITVISNSKSSIKSANIYELKFKVKDTATVGKKVEISTTEILLDTDLQKDSEVIVMPKKVEIMVIDNSKDNESNNKKEDSQNNVVSEGKSEGIDNKENKVSDAPGVLPQTGQYMSFTIICIIIILAIVSYKKYMKYKDVK